MTVDALSQLWAARKILAAVEAVEAVGVLDLMLSHQPTTEEIAGRLGLALEPLRALLRALSWNGVLDEQDGRWSLTAQWRDLLAGPAGRTRRPLLRVESWASQDHLNADGLVAALQGTKRPSEIPDRQVPDLAGAMLTGARAAAPHLARLPELRSRRSLGDVAGGSGGYSVVLCRIHHDLTATIYDRPPMLEHANTTVSGEGLVSRIALVPWDLHTDRIGTGHDVILLSHVLHLLERSARIDLLRRIDDALAPGGLLVLHDFLYDQPAAGSPLAASAIDWISLGTGFHADREMLTAELSEAGFATDRIVPVPSGATALTVAHPRQPARRSRQPGPRPAAATSTAGASTSSGNGASPMTAAPTGPRAPGTINLFRPMLDGAELAAVAEAFDAGWVGTGPRTSTFEAEFAAHIGVDAESMIFTSSCTSALFVALALLDLEPGDEVVLPSISFVAGANAVLSGGGRPAFCDVDPHSLNARLADVERVLTSRTKAVLLLHYGGYPGEVAQIAAMCRDRGLTLIEDAACATASRVDGRACGSFGDIAMWSFDAMKLMTTGDGGMLRVPDPALNRRARRLVYHGLEHMSAFTRATNARRWWELDVREVGFRAVGNDLTAAIGSVQLRRLADFVRRRGQITAYYSRELSAEPGLALPPTPPPGHEPSYYFYWVQMDPRIRDPVAESLYRAGIYTTFKYAPLHRIPLYQADTVLPGSDYAAARTLCLPLHPALDDSAASVVVTELRKAMKSCQ